MSSRLRAIAKDTTEIVDRGWYEHGGQRVEIADGVRRAVAGTRLHLPGEALDVPAVDVAARVEVTGESSLQAAARVGGPVACLNFASARNPGGGFLNGAQAQEESLARSSALYACLSAAWDFYTFHRGERSLLYSDRVIHSPEVPVFKDDRGAVLAQPYAVSFLTAAAPNRAMIVRNQPEHEAEVPGVLARRAARVLEVAAAHGHRRLVLGAWGCGVFGNDPSTVARAFGGALRARPAFELVVFAVLDHQAGTPTRAAFGQVFDTPG